LDNFAEADVDAERAQYEAQEQYSLGGDHDQVERVDSRSSPEHEAMTPGSEEDDNGEGLGFEGKVGDAEDGYIGEFSRDYINAEIFKLFDVNNSGVITKEDLEEVGKQMGWDLKYSKLLILDFKVAHSARICS